MELLHRLLQNLTGITYSLHAHAWDIFQRNQECVGERLNWQRSCHDI